RAHDQLASPKAQAAHPLRAQGRHPRGASSDRLRLDLFQSAAGRGIILLNALSPHSALASGIERSAEEVRCTMLPSIGGPTPTGRTHSETWADPRSRSNRSLREASGPWFAAANRAERRARAATESARIELRASGVAAGQHS